MFDEGIIIDGIKWVITGREHHHIQPLCPRHFLRLHTPPGFHEYSTNHLYCDECDDPYVIPRLLAQERDYVLAKIDSKAFKKMKFINLDDEAIPLAESKASSKDNKYFVTAILTESKVGQRLVVYAGEKGKKEKTQIFIEPDIKRLSFDQKDVHPSEVFASLEATFRDGTKNSIEK